MTTTPLPTEKVVAQLKWLKRESGEHWRVAEVAIVCIDSLVSRVTELEREGKNKDERIEFLRGQSADLNAALAKRRLTSTKPAAQEQVMAMLPNDHHPGPRCSCRECLRQYPTKTGGQS